MGRLAIALRMIRSSTDATGKETASVFTLRARLMACRSNSVPAIERSISVPDFSCRTRKILFSSAKAIASGTRDTNEYFLPCSRNVGQRFSSTRTTASTSFVVRGRPRNATANPPMIMPLVLVLRHQASKSLSGSSGSFGGLGTFFLDNLPAPSDFIDFFRRRRLPVHRLCQLHKREELPQSFIRRKPVNFFCLERVDSLPTLNKLFAGVRLISLHDRSSNEKTSCASSRLATSRRRLNFARAHRRGHKRPRAPAMVGDAIRAASRARLRAL